MRAFIHKLITIALLLALPLQGMSAVLMPFHCLIDEQHEKVTVSAQHHHESAAHEHDRTVPAAVQHDDSETSAHDAGHCYNHVATGAPSVAILTAPDMPFVSVNQISTAPPLFFPEQLLRPPRA